MKVQRGGTTLKTGKIGYANCLRQQIMMPGERSNINISGSVRLETLRERDVLRINAHLATFMTPLRWLWTQFPDYLKEGPDTAIVPPANTTVNNWSIYGVGSYAVTTNTMYQYYIEAYRKCINEWYKWPERNDWTEGEITDDGLRAVPLSAAWSRTRSTGETTDSNDFEVGSTTVLDVRDLAETQAKFRSAMKRDHLSFGRWMELVKQQWNGDGSREVDRVPIMLDQVDLGVNPREMPATDGASLGTWQSMYDFQVNHSIPGVVAPEHCIITHILTIRFAPIIEGQNALANTQLNWQELTGDPEYLAALRPQQVTASELVQDGGIQSLGYLPGGWQWRTGFDVIGKAVDVRDSFPYHLAPSNYNETKDASRIKSAFRSSALDDYLVDLYFEENNVQPIGDAMDSYMAGMYDEQQVKVGGKGAEFPHGGKSL